MVAASTMVADHAPLDARTDVQGAADLVMGVTAAAGALAGLVVGRRNHASPPAVWAGRSCLAASCGTVGR